MSSPSSSTGSTTSPASSAPARIASATSTEFWPISRIPTSGWRACISAREVGQRVQLGVARQAEGGDAAAQRAVGADRVGARPRQVASACSAYGRRALAGGASASSRRLRRANSSHAELGLQPPDLLGDRRLLEQQLVGRARERAVARRWRGSTAAAAGSQRRLSLCSAVARTGLCRIDAGEETARPMITRRTARSTRSCCSSSARRPTTAAGTDPRIAERVSEILLDDRARRRGRAAPLLARARRLGPAVLRAHARGDRRRRARRSTRSCASTCSSVATAPRRSPAPSARRSPTSRSRSPPASSPGHRLVPVRERRRLPAGGPRAAARLRRS